MSVPEDRCPTCGVPLSEPPTTDNCPNPEEHTPSACWLSERNGCLMPVRYAVSRPAGRHESVLLSCSRHLRRTVEYMTVPGRSVAVAVLAHV